MGMHINSFSPADVSLLHIAQREYGDALRREPTSSSTTASVIITVSDIDAPWSALPGKVGEPSSFGYSFRFHSAIVIGSRLCS